MLNERVGFQRALIIVRQTAAIFPGKVGCEQWFPYKLDCIFIAQGSRRVLVTRECLSGCAILSSAEGRAFVHLVIVYSVTATCAPSISKLSFTGVPFGRSVCLRAKYRVHNFNPWFNGMSPTMTLLPGRPKSPNSNSLLRRSTRLHWRHGQHDCAEV